MNDLNKITALYSRMIEDVESSKIGVCIMKDITCQGRDYLQVGNAMEIFRWNNVRFIAVNNSIDSETTDTLEFAPPLSISRRKPLPETEQILFTAAKDYLKDVMNGKTAIPTKTWKTEYAKLTAERKTLNQRYLALKEEVKEAEQIRKSVYSILRQEQRGHTPQGAEYGTII